MVSATETHRAKFGEPSPSERRRQDDEAWTRNDTWFASDGGATHSTGGDAGTVAAWLRWTHGHAIDAGLAGVLVLCSPYETASGDKWQSACFALDELDRAGTFAATASDAGRNVYARATLLDHHVEKYRRGTTAETRWVTSFVADVDIAGPGHKAANLPTTAEAVALVDATLPPSAIVASGGGYYPVWRFAEPVDVAELAVRQRVVELGRRLDEALAAHGRYVDPGIVSDLARVVRPPGVANRKKERDVRAVTVYRGAGDGAGDFTLAELDAVLPPLPPRPHREPPRRHGESLVGSASGVDLFNSRYDIADVLAADVARGWRFVAARGTREQWVDSGSSSSHSLSFDTATGRANVPSARLADSLGVEPLKSSLDLYGLACRLAGRNPSTEGRRK